MAREAIEIQGLREVEEALKSLQPRLAASILRSAHRDILNRFVKPKLRQIPYKRRKVEIDFLRRDKTAVVIGISKENFWLRFLDKGTEPRQTKKGWLRGEVIASNKISSILFQQSDSVLNEVQKNYSSIITKHLNKKLASVQRRLAKL
jgi:hypothetical protein